MKRSLASLALLALVLGAAPAPLKIPVPSLTPVATVGGWTVHYTTMNFNSDTGDFSFPDPVFITRPGGDVRADSATGNSDNNAFTLIGHVILHETRKKHETMTTDKLDIDGAAKTYVATGNVKYVEGTTTATSATGKLNDVTHALDLDGNVTIVRKTSTLVGDHVTYNTVSGKGHATAKAGTITFPATQPSPTPSGKPSPSPSPEPSGSPAPPDNWIVHYTVADFNGNSGDFSIPNGIVIDRSTGGDITADRASGNGKKKLVSLYGHVVVHDVNGSFTSRVGVGSTSSKPTTLTSDQLDIDDLAKKYAATGSVHYVHDRTIADADSATLDQNAHLLQLDGNADVQQPPKSIAADHIVYDTKSGDIHANSAPEKGVLTIFPGGPGPSIAPTKTIVIRNPFSKKPKETPAPSATTRPTP